MCLKFKGMTSEMNEQISLNNARIFGGPLSMVDAAIEMHNIGAIISLINQDTMLETPVSMPQDQHLKLAMNDISLPTDGLVLPGEAHVNQLIEFVSRWDQSAPLLIHCWAGVSRSTAGVFISLCQLNPVMEEAEIALRLRAASPTATPNARLVELADGLMGREGRMMKAAEMIGQGEMTFEGAPFSLPADLGDEGHGKDR